VARPAIRPPRVLIRELIYLAERVDVAGVIEELVEPSFAGRLHNGGAGVRQIMSPDICSLGATVARANLSDAHPKIISSDGQEFEV